MMMALLSDHLSSLRPINCFYNGNASLENCERKKGPVLEPSPSLSLSLSLSTMPTVCVTIFDKSSAAAAIDLLKKFCSEQIKIWWANTENVFEFWVLSLLPNDQIITIQWMIVDVVLEKWKYDRLKLIVYKIGDRLWTRDCKLEGASESSELWVLAHFSKIQYHGAL